MTAAPTRVVYDCNIFAQALISLNGPAARCVQKARESVVSLFVSARLIDTTQRAGILVHSFAPRGLRKEIPDAKGGTIPRRYREPNTLFTCGHRPA